MPAIHSENHGSADVVIGLQHGDESKGKAVDALLSNGAYGVVARYGGGSNAGHTIKVGNITLALHQIPSGVAHPEERLYIGPGCVVHLPKLLQEIGEVEAAGLSVQGRLRISAQASIIQPGHIMRDVATMQKAVGTTGNGIGPAYADQAARVEGDRQLDIRLGDMLVNPEKTFQMIARNLGEEWNRAEQSFMGEPRDVREKMLRDAWKNMGLPSHALRPDGRRGEHVPCIMEVFRVAFERVRPCIERDPQFLLKEIRRGVKVLLEGAQAFGLDRLYGATPDVTSSNTGVAAAFLGSGIPVDYKGRAYGVAKLIQSRVGHGPFPTEFGGKRSEDYCMEDGGKKNSKLWENDQYGARIDEFLRSGDPFLVGIALRILGGEYGASTGRPRRLGAFDAVAVRQAIALNGIDGVFLAKADCLRDFARTKDCAIPAAVAYVLDGAEIDYAPGTREELYRVQPVLRRFEAFEEDIRSIRCWEDLPANLRHMLTEIRDMIGCSLESVGVGPEREQMVKMPPRF